MPEKVKPCPDCRDPQGACAASKVAESKGSVYFTCSRPPEKRRPAASEET